ncbi:hypothetical protein QAS_4079 [Clostridioides difficile CD9]|nr:hypothetical protein QAS_4079 [Clostridioides difficile CD9]
MFEYWQWCCNPGVKKDYGVGHNLSVVIGTGVDCLWLHHTIPDDYLLVFRFAPHVCFSRRDLKRNGLLRHLFWYLRYHRQSTPRYINPVLTNILIADLTTPLLPYVTASIPEPSDWMVVRPIETLFTSLSARATGELSPDSNSNSHCIVIAFSYCIAR